MNARFHVLEQSQAVALPIELEPLAPAPLLLAGESLEQYQLMRQAIFLDLAPRSAIEWLLAIDIVELSWEIQRYRLLRQKVLENFREQAIEQTLRRIDLAGIPRSFQEEATCHTRLNALSWRIDPSAASEIELRLASFGFDQHSINVEVYAQARDLFLMFEALLVSAQNRRTTLLREISSQHPANAVRRSRRSAQ